MRNEMTRGYEIYSKVPEVTLGFWIIKILATTLGETGGDSVTMTWLKADVMVNWGYLIGSAIFFAALIVLVVIQIAAKKFHPFLYWPFHWCNGRHLYIFFSIFSNGQISIF